MQQQGYVIRIPTKNTADVAKLTQAVSTTNSRKLDFDFFSVLKEFKQTHDLKDDAEFSFQVIDDTHTFSAKGKKYSLDGLQPTQVYTDDATLMMDGELVSDMLHYDPKVFTSTDHVSGDTIMVSTKEGADGKKEIDTIVVMSTDGTSDVHLATVLPGVLTTIRPEDLDIPEHIKFGFDDSDGYDNFNILNSEDTGANSNEDYHYYNYASPGEDEDDEDEDEEY